MARIVYYVTDHGFGHASRAIALVRQLENYNLDISVKNLNAFDFLRISLGRSASVHPDQTDVGVSINPHNFSLDYELTKANFGSWYSKAHCEKWITNEKEFLMRNKIDLVLSDISALPFAAAHACGIPSLGISNFSWCDILSNIYEDPYHPVVDKIYEMYEYSSGCIELSFGVGLQGFRHKVPGGLLVRYPTVPKQETRRIFGANDDEYLIFLTAGMSAKFNHKINFTNSDCKVITTSYGNDINRHFIHVPQKYVETQNIVNASDLVIGKAGYGILSECVAQACPILMIPRFGISEDIVYCNYIATNNSGKIITKADLSEMAIPSYGELKKIRQRFQIQQPDNYRIAETVMQFIRG